MAASTHMVSQGKIGWGMLGAWSLLAACQVQSDFHFSTSREQKEAAEEVDEAAQQVSDVYARATDTCILFENGDQGCFGQIDDGEDDYFPGIVERLDCQRRNGREAGCRLPHVKAPGHKWKELRAEQTSPELSKKRRRIIRDAFPGGESKQVILASPVSAELSSPTPAHLCALLDRGRIECIDESSLRRKPFVTGGAKSVFGGERLCAQLEDNSIVCAPYWLGDLAPTHHFPALEGATSWQSGRQLACALTKAGVSCISFKNRLKEDPVFGWGPESDETGKLWQPFKGRAMRLSVGDSHACVVDDKAKVFCWGSRRTGQLGDGAPQLQLDKPEQVELIASARQIVAGSYHSCALLNEKVMCWGDNSQTQLGKNSADLEFSATPIAVALASVTSISAGNYHTCALSKSGSVSCWGFFQHDKDPAPATIPLQGKVTRLVSAGNRDCVIKDDVSVSCWQRAAEPGKDEELIVASLKGATDLALTDAQLCGLVSGKVKCLTWTESQGNRAARHNRKQLDLNAEVVSELPPMKSLRGSCGLSKDSDPWCWGWVRSPNHAPSSSAHIPSGSAHAPSSSAQLRGFQVEQMPKAAQMWSESERRFCSISRDDPGAPPHCAISYIHSGPPGSINEHTPLDGDTLIWDGDGVTRLAPTLSPLAGVAWGEHHQCAIAGDGTVHCWGSIAHGEAGKLPPAQRSDQAIEVNIERALREFSSADLKSADLKSEATVKSGESSDNHLK